MIITVTMNPAIDKTVEIDSFNHGGLNRIKKVTIDAGGKGINVSKTIHALGGESIATGFLGGNNGNSILNQLKEVGVFTDFVKVDSETRVNTKVIEASGIVTELNESGASVSKKDIDELLLKLDCYLNEEALLVLSGSIPNGVSKDIYKKLTEYAHEKGATVFVDADGELFAEALKASPDIIKPNKIELEKYMGYSLESSEKIVTAGKQLVQEGVKTVIISLGADGAYFIDKKHTLYSPGLSVKAHSTVGAGDAMVAAFSYGINQGYSMEECAKLGIATSAGAVTTVGTKPPTRTVVDGLLGQVTMVGFVEN